jgi:hypothetical protein
MDGRGVGVDSRWNKRRRLDGGGAEPSFFVMVGVFEMVIFV